MLYEISTGKDRLDFSELDSQLTEREDKDQLLQLKGVLMKACASDQSRRYRSAEGMHDDLAALARGEAPKKSRAKFVVLGLSILVAAAAIFGFYESRQEPGDFRLQASVKTEPPGALVLLGDRAKRSPATFDDLEPRKYNLRIVLPDYDPVEETIDLGKRKPVALPVFRLTRSNGALEIQSEPAGTQFSLRREDGRISRTGTTAATISVLPTGKYTVKARRGD